MMMMMMVMTQMMMMMMVVVVDMVDFVVVVVGYNTTRCPVPITSWKRKPIVSSVVWMFHVVGLGLMREI